MSHFAIEQLVSDGHIVPMALGGDDQPIAGHERLVVEDRTLRGGERKPFAEQRRLALSPFEQPRERRIEHRRAQSLARVVHLDAEPLGHEVVERGPLELADVERPADRRGQERALVHGRRIVDDAQALEQHRSTAPGQRELRRQPGLGRDLLQAQHLRADRQPLRRHLLGQAAQRTDRVAEAPGRHERSEPVPGHQQALALEHVDGLAQRHERHAELLAEPALRGQGGIRRVVPLLDAPAKLLVNPQIGRSHEF